MSNAHEEPRIVGTLGSTHGKGLVRIQDRLESSVGEVWSALTDPARLAGWYGDVEANCARAANTTRGCLQAVGRAPDESKCVIPRNDYS